MKDVIRIAVDGPSGAGKSTIAKRIADRLGIEYIDTGAMYRAMGYKLKQEGVDLGDPEAVQKVLDSTSIDFSDGNIFLDGENVNGLIRTSEAAKQASACSSLRAVRAKLVDLQRRMGQKKSVIMDGRDIGTNVFPDAEYKFFITASAEERAERRFRELAERGQDVRKEQVLEDILKRDHDDSTRELNPLRRAEDAVEIDTTDMTIAEVTDYMCREMNR